MSHAAPHAQAMSDADRERVFAAVDAGFDDQLATTMRFAAIPSTRGAEGPCQDMMGDLLRVRGYEVDDWRIDQDDLRHCPGFGPVETDFTRARTVVGTYRPSQETGRSLILQGHCDVVPAGPLDMWRRPPFQPVLEDGWLYGRGTGDMKSGTIAALFALDALATAGLAPSGRIHVQSVIEEESTGLGALSTLQRGYRADAALIVEPTDGRVMRAQVGVIWFRVKVRGEPVHAARATAGFNAIKAAYHVLSALEELEVAWNARAKDDPHFGSHPHPLNLNPGIIQGGEWASSVPAWCDVDYRIGVLPGWSIADCQREIEACVEAAAARHPFLAQRPPEVVWSGFLSPGYVAGGTDAMEAALSEAHALGWGGTLDEAVFTGLTDARFYGLDYGIPCFCYGATSEGAHGFDERVDVESLRRLTRSLALFVVGWCGVTAR